MLPHPIGTFLSAPDVHMEMLSLSAGYAFTEQVLYNQAKAVAIQVATENSPTIPLLVEAWRNSPELHEFADAVESSYARLMFAAQGADVLKGKLPTIKGVLR